MLGNMLCTCCQACYVHVTCMLHACYMLVTCLLNVPKPLMLHETCMLHECRKLLQQSFNMHVTCALFRIGMPYGCLASVDCEVSFSQYKHLLNNRRESLSEENTKKTTNAVCTTMVILRDVFIETVIQKTYDFIISYY